MIKRIEHDSPVVHHIHTRLVSRVLHRRYEFGGDALIVASRLCFLASSPTQAALQNTHLVLSLSYVLVSRHIIENRITHRRDRKRGSPGFAGDSLQCRALQARSRYWIRYR